MRQLSVINLIISLGLGMLFWALPVLAQLQPIFIDGFDTYNLGNLNTQGGWTGDTQYQVVNTWQQAGTKSAYLANETTLREILKEGTNTLATGIQSIWLYWNDTRSGATNNIWLKLGSEAPTLYFNLFGFRYNTGTSQWDFVRQDGNTPYSVLTIKSNVSHSVPHSLQVEWNEPEWKYRLKLDSDVWTSWFPFYDYYNPAQRLGVKRWTTQITGNKTWFDSIGGLIVASMTITSPASGSTASSTFTAQVSYDKSDEDWGKIMLVFENWDASSTCPVYGTSVWYDEHSLGYFNYQSFPYFSEFLATGSGDATIEVSDLDENLYNCVRCFFINEETGEISTEKCPDYTLTIAGFIPPSQPLPIKKWTDFYALHSDPKYATSTEIFNTIASAFDTIVQKVGSFLLDFRTIFDKKEAETKGTSLGEKIPLARGYLKPVNDFFSGNLPISEFFILCVLIMIIIGVFRVVKTIVHFIRG